MLAKAGGALAMDAAACAPVRAKAPDCAGFNRLHVQRKRRAERA